MHAQCTFPFHVQAATQIDKATVTQQIKAAAAAKAESAAADDAAKAQRSASGGGKRQRSISSYSPVTLSAATIEKINMAMVLAFVMCGISFRTADNPFFRSFIAMLAPAYYTMPGTFFQQA